MPEVISSDADALKQLGARFKPSKYGQDSEFFLWDKEKEQVVPSYLFYPRKKAALDRYKGNLSLVGNYLTFRDGLAVEVNTPAQTCRAYMINDVRNTLLETRPNELLNLPNVSFSSRPWVEVTKELVKDFPPDLQVLGCHPTLDAYQLKEKVIQVNPKKLFFRTSGSHLHMSIGEMKSGWLTDIPSVPSELWTRWVKACDLFLGVPFTFLYHDELEFKRRKLYGQAGEFRHQQYPKASGLEYRVLSSRLWNHPAIASLFLLIFKYVVGNFNYIFGELQWDSTWDEDIQEAINTGDPKALGRALALWAKLYPGTSHYDAYLLGPSKLSQPEDAWKFWAKAQRIAEKFPEAETVNPSFEYREAHTGWNEYLRNDFASI